MTDLERRVRELRQKLVDADQGDGYPPDGSVWLLDQVLVIIDAHLKEDAEREASHQVHHVWHSGRVKAHEAENARLRWSLKNADEDNDVLKAELARLREVVKSKVEGKKLLRAENTRLREELESRRIAYNTGKEAELTRLRDERDKLHALYNRAQDDASREAGIRVEQGFELARLREDRDLGKRMYDDLELERDDLLAALRKIEREAQDPAVDLHTMMMVVGIARAAIAEAETIR